MFIENNSNNDNNNNNNVSIYIYICINIIMCLFCLRDDLIQSWLWNATTVVPTIGVAATAWIQWPISNLTVIFFGVLIQGWCWEKLTQAQLFDLIWMQVWVWVNNGQYTRKKLSRSHPHPNGVTIWLDNSNDYCHDLNHRMG